MNKVVYYNSLGYEVIQIPYFIQIDTNTIKHYFNKDIDYPSELKNGFNIINKKPNQNNPAVFSELGVKRFEREYDSLPDIIKEEIKETLIHQLHEFQVKELIVPSTLEYLIEEMV